MKGRRILNGSNLDLSSCTGLQFNFRDGYYAYCGYEAFRRRYEQLGSPGLPHAVVPIDDLVHKTNDDLRHLGAAIRAHPSFPKGANVNFYQITGPDEVLELTYERGVEDFTYACGTGTGSVVTVLTLQGRVSGRGVQVDMTGGRLVIDAEREGSRIAALYLTGPTNVVCKGEVTDEDLIF